MPSRNVLSQFTDQWQISEAVQENKEKLEGVPLGILVSACASACDDPNTDTCSPCDPKHRVVSLWPETRGSVMCPDRSTGPAVATWSVKSCGTPDCRRLGRGVGTAHRPLICHRQRRRRRSTPKSERAGVAFRFCAANLLIHITTSAPCTVSLQAFRGGCQATWLWYLRVFVRQPTHSDNVLRTDCG